LIGTGWWILGGAEGRPSPVARALGIGDAEMHLWLARVFAVLLVLPLVFGWRGIATFVRETVRRDPGDLRWWRRWPAATLTGRFARHEGAFDPGQRLMNVVLVGGLVVLTATGIVLSFLHGGSLFATLDRVHRWTGVAVTLAVAGHVVVAAGLLPGYRGAWRSMHLGGRVREDTARRLWPAWTERASDATPDGVSVRFGRRSRS
jgi:formate dehydrogenase subunit gamma